MSKNDIHDNFIRKHYKKTLSAKEISKILNISENGVYIRLQIMRGGRVRPPEESRERPKPSMPKIRMEFLDEDRQQT